MSWGSGGSGEKLCCVYEVSTDVPNDWINLENTQCGELLSDWQLEPKTKAITKKANNMWKVTKY